MRSERASKTLDSLAWSVKFAALTLGLVLPQACIVPKATCEYTKTCVEKTDDASIESNEPKPHDADASGFYEAGIPDGSTIVPTFADASLDANVRTDADAHVSEPQDCERLIECPEALPVCHETERVCTQCDNDFDCKATPDTSFCKLRPGHEQDNECVQCLSSSDCNDGVCVNDECVVCNTKTDEGCTENLPHCVVVDATPTCVLCDRDDDCSTELPVCANHQCVLCTNEDNSHCPSEAPICLTDETPARCVGCRDDNDCRNLAVGDSQVNGLCIDEQCTVCELGTDRNCPMSYPYCVALLPEADGGLTFYRPNAAKADGGVPSEQYLTSAHQCVECVDGDACQGGSLPGCFNGSCVECTETAHCTKAGASVCDTSTHLCVGCSDVGDCAHIDGTSACDTENHVCVECTAERDTCGNKVCQTVPGTNRFACSDEQVESAFICDQCLSDTHCTSNSACVLEVHNGVEAGYHCLPIQGLWNQGNVCADNSPFVGSVTATSVDGRSGTFCKPRTTSCQGFAHYGGGAISNESGEAVCDSDEDCGLSGVADGVCVPWSETTNRCTYQCIGDVDCSTECSNTTAVDESAQQVCSLNP